MCSRSILLSHMVNIVQFSSVTQSCPTLCDPMDFSTPGLSVHHQLPEFTQTHVHWACDTIQPSHPLSSPFPLPSIFPRIRVFSNNSALCIRLPKLCISASASVLRMNIQNWFPLEWTDGISLQFKGLSRVFSNTTVQKHQFFGAYMHIIHCFILEIWASWILLSSRIVEPISGRYQEMPVCILVSNNVSILAHQL